MRPVPFPSHHIREDMLTWFITGDVHVDLWVRVVSAWFFTVKLLLFPFHTLPQRCLYRGDFIPLEILSNIWRHVVADRGGAIGTRWAEVRDAAEILPWQSGLCNKEEVGLRNPTLSIAATHCIQPTLSSDCIKLHLLEGMSKDSWTYAKANTVIKYFAGDTLRLCKFLGYANSYFSLKYHPLILAFINCLEQLFLCCNSDFLFPSLLLHLLFLPFFLISFSCSHNLC